MGLPELSVVGGALGKLRRGTRQLAADERAVPEHVAQTLPELAADLGDALVGCAAVRTGVAAVLNKGDGRIRWAEQMIPDRIHRPVETIGRDREGWDLGRPPGRRDRFPVIGQGARGAHLIHNVSRGACQLAQ